VEHAGFHPLTRRWFDSHFREPTEAQRLGWPEIMAGRHTLIAAPTGSGKTLAAFLSAIDQLVRAGEAGRLHDATQVVYVSPLKALSNDVHRNLETPLAEIRGAVPIRALVRTGDTPTRERQAMLRRPPHILVTTPESLYLLLTAEKSREILRTVKTVIVDEIHAVARDKRGSHLALSLERLEALCAAPPVRIGLSATQRPIEEIARFLVGARRVDASGHPQCSIVDGGHLRTLDVAVEVPPSDLGAVCTNETWEEIYRRLADLIASHRSTLIFVNTRRLAERLSQHLRELLGEEAVMSHHGSLSRQIRLNAEERLKAGQLRAIVATSSLELGIDIGFIDLVCQIGSPRAVNTFLQRVGRSGHSLGATPKGRLFALTRDELLECLALIRAVKAGRLDRVDIPRAPLDILAQQMVASVACEEWGEDELFALCRGAWPYRDLSRRDFDAVLAMLSERSGARCDGVWLHRDAIHHRVRPRRGARMIAIVSGGAIPESGDYRVVTEDERSFVGTVNEDFAVESMAGDVFLLGNTSWRIRHIRGGEVVVKDAQGAPANVPFWLGEASARTPELSAEIAALCSSLEEELRNAGVEQAVQNLCSAGGITEPGALQACSYVAAQLRAVGFVPDQKRLLFERFFDESGGMQFVIHAPFGARINRAWGFALRKRFCRSFNFELQASADDNGIVLSLGPQHSFPLEQMFKLLPLRDAERLLTQAVLDAPLFQIRWRWNATRALAVLRHAGGRKIPAPLQRFRANDALSAVFPAQTACRENVTGDIEVPDHPLVRQTIYDCLHEAMDVDGWLALLGRIERNEIELIARETREPSPFSHERLNAHPYSFLDDAPLEERRARAVAVRRTLAPEELGDLARLDPEAIAQVRSEAWPVVRDADELYDTLAAQGALPEADGESWRGWFRELVESGRAAEMRLRKDGPVLWVAAGHYAAVESGDGVPLVRGRLEICGPATASEIARDLGLETSAVESALEYLEGEGFALRGRFSGAGPRPAESANDEMEWCERRLLARIHRLTIEGLRRQIRPAEPEVIWRFLMKHQHVAPGTRLEGRAGVLDAIAQLQGFEIAAGAWESEIFPSRVADYDPAWLDELSFSGETAWGRLQPPRKAEGGSPSRGTITRVVPISLMLRADLAWLLPPDRPHAEEWARGGAREIYDALAAHGAMFTEDLRELTGLLPSQVDEALSELAALGLATADGVRAIRLLSASNRHRPAARKLVRESFNGGRWSLFPPAARAKTPAASRTERWAWQLLGRYGVVFRDLLQRETAAPQWPALSQVYRRLEAAGQIRGGRFASGVAGEQFATMESVDRLRQVRDEADDDGWIIVSASDPLNLSGILSGGARVAASPHNRLAIRAGRVLASIEAGEIRHHVELQRLQADRVARDLRVSGVQRRSAGAIAPRA
jgi:ATP-dependent Lhr-like helicase